MAQQQKDSTILFSIKSKEYKCLSNDYILPMYINGIEYYHVTGFVLSQKFLGFNDKLSTRIRQLSSPIMCRKVSLESTLDKESESSWQSKKVIIETRIGIMTKFLSNGEYGKELLSTGNKTLIYVDPEDKYWGCDTSMKGNNLLGIILMDTRDKIKNLVNISTLTNNNPSKSLVTNKVPTINKQVPKMDIEKTITIKEIKINSGNNTTEKSDTENNNIQTNSESDEDSSGTSEDDDSGNDNNSE